MRDGPNDSWGGQNDSRVLLLRCDDEELHKILILGKEARFMKCKQALRIVYSG